MVYCLARSGIVLGFAVVGESWPATLGSEAGSRPDTTLTRLLR